MGAHSVSNLWFYCVYIAGDVFNHQYPASGWNPDLLSVYQSRYSDINFFQNKFASLPEKLNYTGTSPKSDSDSFLGTYYVTTYFDYPGNGKTSWNNAYNGSGSQAGANFVNTAYVHIFESGSKVVIQYYYFYPFNDFKNNHEGDWQHINVIVTSRNPNDAELAGVDYKFHGRGIVYSSIGERIFNPRTHFAPAEGGTHPVVYVGAGSHGGYPTGGNYPDPGGTRYGIGIDEDMTTDGIVLSTSVSDTRSKVAQSYDLVLLPEPNKKQANMGLSPAMSWLGTGARWGTLTVASPISKYNDSPHGPFQNGSWGNRKNNNYNSDKVPYTQFQQFPIVQNVTWKDTIDLIGDIVVCPGATLTIEAGTVIRSHPNRDIHEMKDASRVDIINYGKFVADASGKQQIVFRADNSTPSAGDWYGIRNYGTLTMKNCKIQHAVTGLYRQGTETLRDVVVTDSKNNTAQLTVASIDDVTAKAGETITPIQVNASGGWSPYTYSLYSTPSGSGLSISSSGKITGTPTQTGTFTIEAKVTSHDAQSDSTSFQMSVSSTLNISPISDVTVNLSQNITPIQVSVSGGSGEYRYSIQNAPAGITISSLGKITGTPTECGVYDITVTAVEKLPGDDGTGTEQPIRARASRSFQLYVRASLEIGSISDVSATKNEAIADLSVSASCGKTPYTYSLSGAPSGITVSSSGTISGTPTATGTSTITVTVNDDDDGEASTAFTLTVSDSLTVASIDDVTATHHDDITAIQVSASGGRTPYTYSLEDEPDGITVSSSGTISGAPTEVGTSTITVTVSDDDDGEASTSFDLTVEAVYCDFNGDGAVNYADYLLFVAAYGTSEGDEGYDAQMDLNGDGTINIPDFLIFVDHYEGDASELSLPSR